ncbi:hypothetical protein ACQKFO_23125 [Rossellomorea sp. NPDC071047]|uniref:hypothetical protein n=1 Tax=Rossellomorea sp. NPDC071047 TaxID=3390675 RepID=UPI003D05EE23
MVFTIYKAKLSTAGKTTEQIKADYEGGFGDVPSEKEVQAWIDAYNRIDGIEMIVLKSPIMDGYVPTSCVKEEDEPKFRDFVYQAEQDPYFGSYINDREEFLKDWESGDYSPSGSLTFKEEDLTDLQKEYAGEPGDKKNEPNYD